MTLETASSLRARIAGAAPVNMRVATGMDGGSAIVFLGVRSSSGQNLWLELDSGDLADVLLATHVRVDSGTSAAAGGDVQLSVDHRHALTGDGARAPRRPGDTPGRC